MKDFSGHWGFSQKTIMKMPREQFCQLFGMKYLGLSDSKFLKVLSKDTPDVEPTGWYLKVHWKEDKPAEKVIYKGTQLGDWDSVNVFV